MKTIKKTQVKKSNLSSADFIRKTPGPAKDVVAKAKAAGITFSIAYVYSIRTATKKAATTPLRATILAARTDNAEAVLLAVAAEIGLSRALEILNAQRASVVRLITG